MSVIKLDGTPSWSEFTTAAATHKAAKDAVVAPASPTLTEIGLIKSTWSTREQKRKKCLKELGQEARHPNSALPAI